MSKIRNIVKKHAHQETAAESSCSLRGAQSSSSSSKSCLLGRQDEQRQEAYSNDEPIIKPVASSLGSFARSVGPATDIRELEYISSLHQNAEPFLRLDGTICSKDIPAYLSSRYGMEITPKQAIDIAVNLCGGKLRGELSAEQDEQRAMEAEISQMMDLHSSIRNNMHQRISSRQQQQPDYEDDDDDEDDEKAAAGAEKELPVYYFDLVQLMSLLLIPELVQQLCDNGSNPSNNNCYQNGYHASDGESSSSSLKLGTQKGGPLDLIVRSMTEVFDEAIQKDILEGKRPLDEGLLATMLDAYGDADAANDEVLIRDMLKALGQGGTCWLTPETFLNALTEDVKSYPCASNNPHSMMEKNCLNGDDKNKPSILKPNQTSLYYDIFGRNWEDRDNDAKRRQENGYEQHQNLGNAPKPTDTASFIDYAADTYGSVALNTTLWTLFLLSTLVYLNFFVNVMNHKTDGLFCSSEKNVACAIGNRIVGWILTAVFCGFYGILFIVPASVGNVPGKTLLIYFTLMVTAAYTYAPFSTLIWFRQGVPHNAETTHDYRVICPAWISENLTHVINPQGILENITHIIKSQEDFNKREDGAQWYVRLDSSCHPAKEWCEQHREVQGKYIDPTPNFLTPHEFEKCYSLVEQWLLRTSWLRQTGEPCNPFDMNAACPENGACGLRGLNNANDTLFGEEYICCHSGKAIPFASTRYQDSGHDLFHDLFGNTVCDNQPTGQSCRSSAMCEADAVCENGFCAVPRGQNKTAGWLGTLCNRQNGACKSGFCWNKTCLQMPKLCPAEETKSAGGFRLDPFCRTFDDWCAYTDLSQFSSGFKEKVGVTEVNRVVCNQVLKMTVKAGLVKVLNESEAEIGHTHVHANYSQVEEILLQDWAYLVLLSIAVVGFFALLPILMKVMSSNDAKNRPRDHNIKVAAASKIANVIDNAMQLHTQGADVKGRVLRNFFLRGEKKVEAGGFFWTAKNLWSGNLSMEEGIRYSGRIWVGLVAQVVVTCVQVLFAVTLILNTGIRLEETREELGKSYTQQDVEDISNYDWATVTLDELHITDEEQLALDALPERWMFDAAAIPGAIAGFLVAVFCILVCIPSTTTTIIQLRNGQLPSLHDPYFATLRKTPDYVVQNVGNMVFTLMGASSLMAIFIFLLIFAFTYNVTRQFAINYLGIAIGIGVTLLIKYGGQALFRETNFSSLYRKKPKRANYVNLFFECWYIGTAALVVFTRVMVFLLSSALWLGRIDVEYLHPNVRVLGIPLDSVPLSFKRDILVHEAHIHPYIERLGAMYLLRLRDGDGFGSVAGTTWRSLFVCGLMPWMAKHRVNTDEEATLVQDHGYGRRRSSIVSVQESIPLPPGTAAGTATTTTTPEAGSEQRRRSSFLPSEDALRSRRRVSMLSERDDSIRSIVSI